MNRCEMPGAFAPPDIRCSGEPKGRMSPRSLNAITAGAFVVLGSVAAYLAHGHAVPVTLTLAAATLLFVWIQRAHEREHRAGRTRPILRVIPLLFCLGAMLIGIGATGGAESPFTGILFLPILLATLSFGFNGGVLMGILVSSAFLILGMRQGSAWALPPDVILIRMIVFLLVAVAVGAFASNLRRMADEAAARAHVEQERAAAHAARAAETEAFLDTSVMMESMYDLDNTLNIALIRLSDLVPYDVCAVFLREIDAPHLHIARHTSLDAGNIAVRSLALEEAEALWGDDTEARLWPNLAQNSAGLGTLAALDPDAGGVIVAPLRTLDDFYGLIYVSAHQEGVLTERHRSIVHQFAQHVVFPIQRMRLQAMATTDAMTGLDNYRSFRMRLAEEVRRAYRYGHAVSLILLDIDHFKRINDTYLHVAGDAILRQMATVLRKSLRGIDVAARYGGEEMAIICPETASDDARTLAERIRATVEATNFELPEGGAVQLTVSLGVATLPLQAAGDAALVEQADKALYAAKTGGRNAVRTAADVMVEAAV